MAGFFMRGRMGGMQPAIGIAAGILVNVAPLGVAIILLVLRDRQWRFNLSMLLTLTTLVALSAWALGTLLRGP
jgi:Na+-translocating ferredoxin:NAD+ oxidoreductase RnfD subunit